MWAAATHVDDHGPAVEHLPSQLPFRGGPPLGIVGQFGYHERRR